MNFIPTDIIGHIADYGCTLPVSKELLISKILNLEPKYDFRKCYLIRLYKSIALGSRYGKIIKYMYENDIEIIRNRRLIVKPSFYNKIQFSKNVTAKFKDILLQEFSFMYIIEDDYIKRNFIYGESLLNEFKFFWKMYNCNYNYRKCDTRNMFLPRMSQHMKYGYMSLEINPEKGFWDSFMKKNIKMYGDITVGNVYLTCKIKGDTKYLNYAGIIKSLGIDVINTEIHYISDDILNSKCLEWDQLLDRIDLLDILNECNIRHNFIKRYTNEHSSKLYDIISKYDRYTVDCSYRDRIILTGNMYDEVKEQFKTELMGGDMIISFNDPGSFWMFMKYHCDINYEI